MDRGCITYSAAYLAGAYLGNVMAIPFSVSATVMALLLLLCMISKKRYTLFIAASHLALMVAGCTGYRLAESNRELPQSQLKTHILSKASSIKEKTESYLEKFTADKENHSTLCALVLGSKYGLEKGLISAYSKAGAMHILALSGLHVGIIYTIIGMLLSPLLLIPRGKYIKEIAVLLFLAIYSLVCGAPPSVVRASTMIILYRIGINSFRNVSRWDALALSALAIGVFSPLQISSAGFQLSYAAVIGISLIFPTLNEAFREIAGADSISGRTTRRLLQKIWDNISISICCQAATLPFVLYYFGNVANHFIITNMVAIPVATAVLYTFSLLITFQWIPFANGALTALLNFFIELLNDSVIYISN